MTEVTNWKRISSRVLRANEESLHYWSMPPGFRYPVEPSPRIVFYDGSGAFQPELEAAETAALPANLLGVTLKSVWRPRYGLVVFTGQGCGSLTEHDGTRSGACGEFLSSSICSIFMAPWRQKNATLTAGFTFVRALSGEAISCGRM